MIGAALVFDDPATEGLPRARGILAPADANASTRQNVLARDAQEMLVLSGCLRHTLDFSKIFNFPVHYTRN
jgi:hypothetical protein